MSEAAPRASDNGNLAPPAPGRRLPMDWSQL